MPKQKISKVLNYTPRHTIQDWQGEYYDEDSPTGFTDRYETIEVASDCEVEFEDGSRKKLKVSKTILGKGKFDYARALEGTPEESPMVVLTSNIDDLSPTEVLEAISKYKSTAEMHSKDCVKLFLFKGRGKRQIEPLAEGENISRLQINTLTEGLKVCLEVAKSLHKFHTHQGKIHFDFHGANVFYAPHKATIIDPGNAVKIGNPLNINIYGNDTHMANKDKYPQIAPECWSKQPVLAHTSMDVYAYANLMWDKIKKLIPNDSKGQALNDLFQSARD